MTRLQAGEIDLGVCLKAADMSHFESHPIFSDELQMLVSPHHSWATSKPKMKDAAGQTFIVSSRNSLSYSLLNDLFLRNGIRLTSTIELGSTEAMKELAKLGIDVAIAAAWTAQAEIKAKQLISLPLPKGSIRRAWVTAHLKGRPLNLAERTFVGLCQEVGHQMSQGG